MTMALRFLDCIREVRAPFQPEAVVEDFCTTLAAYGVAQGVRAIDMGASGRASNSRSAMWTYVPSERVKSDIYRDTLPLLNSPQVPIA